MAGLARRLQQKMPQLACWKVRGECGRNYQEQFPQELASGSPNREFEVYNGDRKNKGGGG